MKVYFIALDRETMSLIKSDPMLHCISKILGACKCVVLKEFSAFEPSIVTFKVILSFFFFLLKSCFKHYEKGVF